MTDSDRSIASPAKVVDVAVGVIERPDGQVLLACRPPGRPYAGYWEFPGGKVEPGEPVADALARELDEELGLRGVQSTPWLVVGHTYPHATVRLYFRRVRQWQGEPQSREGQQLSWQPASHIALAPLLPASLGPIRWLALPPVYAISCAGLLGVSAFEEALERALEAHSRQMDFPASDKRYTVSASSHFWLQLREPDLPASQCEAFFERLLAVRARARLRLIVSSRHPASWWQQADGVHLTARDLMAAQTRPQADWVAASCHTPEELRQAAALGCDFAVAGPVLPTASHPGAPTIGFDGLASLTAQAALPVFGLGGLQTGLLESARAAGAQGVALMRAAWD
jgi:8-oxo-dGTP diphosphatase